MKNPSRLFILVLVLLVFLASLLWVGVRRLGDILGEFDHVAQVDLVLMETATGLNDLQLKKEIIFAKLSAASDELAFGGANSSRQQYLADYVKGLSGQFDQYTNHANQQMQRVEKLSGVPQDIRNDFIQIRGQTEQYDAAVQNIFKAVEKGGYQMSLDDLDLTDSRQRSLTDNVQGITAEVWGLVQGSIHKSRHWHAQYNVIFWFSLSLTATLAFLLFAYKRNLDEINQQKKDLEKLNHELDRFVHTVSHDIAGPLTTIVGYAAHLEAKYAQQLDQKGRDSIKGVRKGAARLNVLIKDMLELTKMSRVKNPYSRIAVREVVDAALANCDFMIRQFNAQIKVNESLPVIVGDRIKITIAFTNLINNALKYTRPGVAPEISIGWSETLKDHEFYVKDNGIGISPENHARVFEIFQRLHTADEYSGSGAGLTIVKAAVEDQGGRVWIESTLGQGAKFIFTIPKNLVAAKSVY